MKLDVKNINFLMAEQEISQAELAERCGVMRQNIHAILNRGTCLPKTAGKLAKALGVNVREIVKEED